MYGNGFWCGCFAKLDLAWKPGVRERVGLLHKASSMFNTDILPILVTLLYRSLRARIIEHGARVSKISSLDRGAKLL